MNLFELSPGEYVFHEGYNAWVYRLPTSEDHKLFGNLGAHEIIEHEDKTITVSPSILVTTHDGKRWHGYLRRGIWERLPDSNV